MVGVKVLSPSDLCVGVCRSPSLEITLGLVMSSNCHLFLTSLISLQLFSNPHARMFLSLFFSGVKNWLGKHFSKPQIYTKKLEAGLQEGASLESQLSCGELLFLRPGDWADTVHSLHCPIPISLEDAPEAHQRTPLEITELSYY